MISARRVRSITQQSGGKLLVPDLSQGEKPILSVWAEEHRDPTRIIDGQSQLGSERGWRKEAKNIGKVGRKMEGIK